MALLNKSFSVNSLPEGSGYGTIPAGWYGVTISKAEVKTIKAGNGEYINIMFTITGPTHQGRTVWGRINIRNPNPKAEEIGLQQLGELLRATGIAQLSNTDQLIRKELSIKVIIKEDDQGERNEVKGFKALQGGVIPSIKPTAAPAAPATATAPPFKNRPW